MLVIPGFAGTDTCDGLTRRDFMRVGGSAVFGLSLLDFFGPSAFGETTTAAAPSGGPGFGKAKNVILLYLFGGPSQLDTLDMKPSAAAEARQRSAGVETK